MVLAQMALFMIDYKQADKNGCLYHMEGGWNVYH